MSEIPCESTLRCTLHEKGYRLMKSHASRWSEKNQGGYRIVALPGSVRIKAGAHYELSLEDVYEFIKWLG